MAHFSVEIWRTFGLTSTYKRGKVKKTIDLMIEVGIFDEKRYREKQILSSLSIQKQYSPLKRNRLPELPSMPTKICFGR